MQETPQFPGLDQPASPSWFQGVHAWAKLTLPTSPPRRSGGLPECPPVLGRSEAAHHHREGAWSPLAELRARTQALALGGRGRRSQPWGVYVAGDKCDTRVHTLGLP